MALAKRQTAGAVGSESVFNLKIEAVSRPKTVGEPLISPVINVIWHLELFGGFRAIRVDSHRRSLVHAGAAHEALPAKVPENELTLHNAPLVVDGFRSQKTTALLAYLAVFNQGHRREWLGELLWPDAEPRNARNSLRVALHNLRDTLEDAQTQGQILNINRELVSLSEAVTCDVQQFRALHRQSFAQNDEKLLEKAISLVKGPFLRGIYEEWIAGEAARLEDEWLSASRQLMKIREARGDFLGALDIARRAALVAPSGQGVKRDVVRLAVACGEKESVRQEFEAWRKTSQRIGDQKIPDWNTFVGSFSSPTTSLPGNSFVAATAKQKVGPKIAALPRRTSFFTGRNAEVARLEKQFAGGARLQTVTGMGGVGKTRLALEIAWRARERDAVALWVSLAHLPSSNLLCGAVLEAACASGEESLDHIVSVLGALRVGKSPILLVLDNCEHISHGVAELADSLLEAAPFLQILATSLGPLHLSDEQILPLEPLGAEGVDLFVQRARQTRPDFALTDENREIVETLCARLSGLPLAIEIAAARSAIFTPAQMLAALEASEPLEKRDWDAETETSAPAESSVTDHSIADDSVLDWRNSNRDAPNRHRSLRQAIEWSSRQLTTAAAKFWAKLSVFTDDFTLDAASAICGETQTPSLVLTLRDCSLLGLDTSGDVPRGTWVESLRQYAKTRLSASEWDALQDAHARYFLELSQRLSAQLDGPGAALALQKLEAEKSHFGAAAQYLLRGEIGETRERREAKLLMALQLCAALAWYWEKSGHLELGRETMEEALEVAQQIAPSETAIRSLVLDLGSPASEEERARALELSSLRARVMESAGKIANFLADHDGAIAHIESALRLFRLIGDDAGAATCLYALGFGAMQRGEIEMARTLCEQSVALIRRQNDSAALGDALYNLALVATFSGDFETAHQLSRERLDLLRVSGDRRGVALSLENMGMAAIFQGQLDAARAYYNEALSIFEALAEGASVARCLWGIGQLERLIGNWPIAHALFSRSLKLSHESQNFWAVPYLLESFGYLGAAQGEFERAAQLLGGAAQLREIQGEPLPAPQQRAEFAAFCEQVRDSLGDDTFAAHWQNGRTLERSQLIALALGE